LSEGSNVQEVIAQYFECDSFAVVGASTNREKYGNKVLRAYQQRNLRVYPINPKADRVEGLEAYADLASLPEPVCGVSIITPPKITERVVDEAAAAGVRFVWMQPGAESDEAVRKARAHGMGVIADGSCFLVVAGYTESE
jgi:predicted CoA-binding protein